MNNFKFSNKIGKINCCSKIALEISYFEQTETETETKTKKVQTEKINCMFAIKKLVIFARTCIDI